MGWLRDYNRRYNVSGGQWFLFFAFLFSLWVAASGQGPFSWWTVLIVFGILSLISAPFRAVGWVNRRLNSRPCLVCGRRIPNGETQCAGCGTDFRVR